MLTTAARDAILNTFDSHFLALLVSITDWRAGTLTEASYTGYARIALTLGSPAAHAASGRQRASTGTHTFAANTGSSQDVRLWAINSASTAGTWKWIGGLSADSPVAAQIEDLTNDRFKADEHGLVVDQRVYLLAAPGAVLPAGVSENTLYFVGTVPDTDHFTLSTTAANANPVAITGLGACLVIAADALTVANGQSPEIAAGGVVIAL